MDSEEDKKKRYSILKTPKSSVEDSPTIDVTEKLKRRVSFASSNFIKPFAADPEKNTIWDTTYEEFVNYNNTDSTKSSSQDTKHSDYTPSILMKTDVFSRTDCENPSLMCDSFKENIPSAPFIKYMKPEQSSMAVSLRNDDAQISQNRSVLKNRAQNNSSTELHKVETNYRNSTVLDQSCMDFTSVLSSDNEQQFPQYKDHFNDQPPALKQNKAVMEQSGMELTGIYSTINVQENRTTKSVRSIITFIKNKNMEHDKLSNRPNSQNQNRTKLDHADMEFTGVFPLSRECPKVRHLTETNVLYRGIENHTRIDDSNMEFTGVIPFKNYQGHTMLNQPEELTDVSNESPSANAKHKKIDLSDMEFTSALPNTKIIDYSKDPTFSITSKETKDTEKDSHNHTKVRETSMEVTEILDVKLISDKIKEIKVLDSKQNSDAVSKSIDENTMMELTCAIPMSKILVKSNVHINNHIGQFKDFKGNESKSESPICGNNTSKNESKMEFTGLLQYGGGSNENVPNQDESMELTKVLINPPHSNTTVGNFNNKTQFDQQNMDITGGSAMKHSEVTLKEPSLEQILSGNPKKISEPKIEFADVLDQDESMKLIKASMSRKQSVVDDSRNNTKLEQQSNVPKISNSMVQPKSDDDASEQLTSLLQHQNRNENEMMNSQCPEASNNTKLGHQKMDFSSISSKSNVHENSNCKDIVELHTREFNVEQKKTVRIDESHMEFTNVLQCHGSSTYIDLRPDESTALSKSFLNREQSDKGSGTPYNNQKLDYANIPKRSNHMVQPTSESDTSNRFTNLLQHQSPNENETMNTHCPKTSNDTKLDQQNMDFSSISSTANVHENSNHKDIAKLHKKEFNVEQKESVQIDESNMEFTNVLPCHGLSNYILLREDESTAVSKTLTNKHSDKGSGTPNNNQRLDYDNVPKSSNSPVHPKSDNDTSNQFTSLSQHQSQNENESNSQHRETSNNTKFDQQNMDFSRISSKSNVHENSNSNEDIAELHKKEFNLEQKETVQIDESNMEFTNVLQCHGLSNYIELREDESTAISKTMMNKHSDKGSGIPDNNQRLGYANVPKSSNSLVHPKAVLDMSRQFKSLSQHQSENENETMNSQRPEPSNNTKLDQQNIDFSSISSTANVHENSNYKDIAELYKKEFNGEHKKSVKIGECNMEFTNVLQCHGSSKYIDLRGDENTSLPNTLLNRQHSDRRSGKPKNAQKMDYANVINAPENSNFKDFGEQRISNNTIGDKNNMFMGVLQYQALSNQNVMSQDKSTGALTKTTVDCNDVYQAISYNSELKQQESIKLTNRQQPNTQVGHSKNDTKLDVINVQSQFKIYESPNLENIEQSKNTEVRMKRSHTQKTNSSSHTQIDDHNKEHKDSDQFPSFSPESMDCESFIIGADVNDASCKKLSDNTKFEENLTPKIPCKRRKTMTSVKNNEEMETTESFIKKNYTFNKSDCIKIQDDSEIVFPPSAMQRVSFEILSDSDINTSKEIVAQHNVGDLISREGTQSKGLIHIEKSSTDHLHKCEISSKIIISRSDTINKSLKELFLDQEPKEGLTTTSIPTSNKILYTQGIINDLTRSIHLGITPSTSFNTYLSEISCIEDTQQLINAQISQPEALQEWQSQQPVTNLKDEDTCNLDSIHVSCNTSAAQRVLSESVSTEVVRSSLGSSDLNSSSNETHNFSRHCKNVLKEISNYLIPNDNAIKTIWQRRQQEIKELEALEKEFFENRTKISRFVEKFRLPKFKYPGMDEYLRRTTNGSINAKEVDEKGPALDVTKPLIDRVKEAAAKKSNSKLWQLIKVDGDTYHFETVYHTVKLEVGLDPDQGTVYSVHTSHKLLSGKHPPEFFYNAELMQHKLRMEHLASVLGPRYDVLALMDYVGMAMSSLNDFYNEYLLFQIEFGFSHGVTINSDLCVVFEILNVKFVIWWVIKMKLSLSNVYAIEEVTVEHKKGPAVDCEHIRRIVNSVPYTPKDYYKMIVEKVEEYVQIIGRGVRYQNMKKIGR